MSQFINDAVYSSDFSSEIDFDTAELLSPGGSTCDIYRTKWQRHTVFVKRLKEEFRSKPLYLDALDKEYEIGVHLRHPALPVYLHFQRDYVVVEYIDGKTLAELIKAKDPWLSKQQNVVRLLKELTEVVGYLHRHNVVHCDVKPDNIMITNNNRNLVLIDFDKCYTDSLDDTSGHPARFGLPSESHGRAAMDLRGIARVAEAIAAAYPNLKSRKFNNFIKQCYRPGVNADNLLESLGQLTVSNLRWLKPIALLSLILLAGVISLFYFSRLPDEKNVNPVEAENPEQPIEETSVPPTKSAEPTDDQPAMPTVPAATTSLDEVTQEQLHDVAKRRAEVLDRRISADFEELTAELTRLITLKQDRTLTGPQLLDKVRAFVDKEEEYKREAIAIVEESFPGITERELRRVFTYSKVLTTYNRLSVKELADMRREVERRSPELFE
ncbi:MAG: protein kinase [Muribaculaceae bacterium]|nr:protein kinase [Muribaculaceae bacterium]